MTQTVKLAKLKRSEKNVRTTPPKNIEAMAASIRPEPDPRPGAASRPRADSDTMGL